MTDVTGTSADQATEPRRFSLRGTLSAAEIDLRLFGMLVILAAILLGFNIASPGGTFLRPANIATLAVQASGIAVLATGMVLVIVARNIDLSVGSLVGLIAMTYAVLMTDWLPNILGMNAEFPFRWLIALAIGVGLGAVVGGLQGFIIAYVGVPSFVVTLGGLLSIRGVVWVLSQGAAVSGLDPTFQRLGGSAEGSIGGTLTWGIGIAGCVAIVGLLAYNRRQRRRFGFPLRPTWADATLGVIGCLAVVGLAAFANENLWPKGAATRYALEHGITQPPGGLQLSVGIPWPVVILIAVTLLMAFLATRLRFGRYVYAYGGNPEAADLAGINTRWTLMKIYILMGVLCAISAAIAAARLDGATLDVGQSYELYVIAAAVVGGTSFAGGIGTVTGAILGAFVMGSLSYGLAYLGVNSPIQNIVAGIVLVLAVGFDAWNRRRGGR
ncbi:MAG: sugar ABC transporter permease [Candidatus Limnocylindrales bacterium]